MGNKSTTSDSYKLSNKNRPDGELSVHSKVQEDSYSDNSTIVNDPNSSRTTQPSNTKSILKRPAEVEKTVTNKLSATFSTSSQMEPGVDAPTNNIIGPHHYDFITPNKEKIGDEKMNNNEEQNSTAENNGQLSIIPGNNETSVSDEEDDDSRPKKESEPYRIVKFLRSMIRKYWGPIDTLVTIVCIVLYIVAMYLPFYGKALIYLFELVSIGIWHMLGEDSNMVKTLGLSLLVLLPFLSLVFWSYTILFSLYIYAALFAIWAKNLWSSGHYKSLFLCILGFFSTILLCVNQEYWFNAEGLSTLWICISPFMVFMAVLYSIGFIFKVLTEFKVIRYKLADMANEVSKNRLDISKINKKIDKVNKKIKKEEDKLPKDQAKTYEHIRERNILEFSLNSIKKKNSLLISNAVFESGLSVVKVFSVSPLDMSYEVLNHFSKYWPYILAVLSVIVVLSLMAVNSYIRSNLPLVDYILFLIQNIKNGSLLAESEIIMGPSILP
ncbi:hypothetical protein NEMIN01_0300 [Nematocida minor]|uniref:uncharacterized protein n=1 Tax=Nematocida minor TaxID=1912983 RepID=UPI00221FA494|nr:uncharacterized protein NEMIN01_0300 [Nematocida minor]KAI5189134.1 hypothetical protein NEMIN01_0300 [Nematocida minor]